MSSWRSAVTPLSGLRSASVINYIQTQQDGAAEIPAQSGKLVDRPNFHSELRSQELFEGQPLHLETKLTPFNDPSLNVQFFLNGNPVQADGRVQVQVQAGFVVLHIEEAQQQDSGNYTVQASNDAGTAESSATILVVGESANPRDRTPQPAWTTWTRARCWTWRTSASFSTRCTRRS